MNEQVVYRLQCHSRFCVCVCVCVSLAGNENLHLLTSDRRQILRIEMKRYLGDLFSAEYDQFLIGSESENYKLLSLGNFDGNIGQSGSGRFVKQQQWERWQAKRKLVSGFKHRMRFCGIGDGEQA